MKAERRRFFHEWFFDEATERQLQRIRNNGLKLSTEAITKGQASDIIGLFEPIEEDDEEILRFFKIALKGFNQSRARHEVAKLLADPKSAEAWRLRPAHFLQKEFYRFFGFEIPRGLTHLDAERVINEQRERLEVEGSQLLNDWDSFESIYTDLTDSETCEVYDIRKPKSSIIQAAVDALRKEGRSLSELEGDLQLVVDKMIQLKPELRRKNI